MRRVKRQHGCEAALAIAGRRRGLTTILLLLVMGIASAGAASADELLARGALRGEDWVRGKHTESRTLLIGDAIYHVGSQTVLRDVNGETLSFSGLDTVPELESLRMKPRVASTWARFDATEVAGRLILNWLELSDDHEGNETPGSGRRKGAKTDKRAKTTPAAPGAR